MEEKISILLLGDRLENFPNIGKIADHLGMELISATTVDAAREAVGKEPVSLIIADASAPDFDHTAQINALRGTYAVSQIPMIMFGGRPGDFLARSADEGPLDYVPHDVAPHQLITRIRLMADWFFQRNRIEYLEAENERLDTINKQVRKFVGNVAHDLRGPLGKLINTSEVLLGGVEPEALPTFYEMMAQTSRRGFNLVNDILDITALESGRLQLHFEKCDLGDIAVQVFEEVGYLAQKKNQHLDNRVPLQTYVRADRRRMYQVLGNLVNNSIKFTPRGGSITLACAAEGAVTGLEIRDTGVGIPAEKLPKLFLKHVKNSTPGTEGEQGTGFGLSLAQEIAMAHGAAIEVDSRLGEGTTFRVRVPTWQG